MFRPPSPASTLSLRQFHWCDRSVAIVVLLGYLLGTGQVLTARAQIPSAQERPLSVYLDLRPALLNAQPQTTPSWVKSLEFTPAVRPGSRERVDTATLPATAPDKEIAASEALLVQALRESSEARSIFHLAVQRPYGAASHLQVRIFFDDVSLGTRPELSVRNARGAELMHSPPLGMGLGLPSSETLIVPMVGAGGLDIEVPGDGSTVRGVFLTWVGSKRVIEANDFPSDERVRQPFGGLAPARPSHDDSYLYGVVTAGLQGDKPLLLKPVQAPAATFQFELEQRPLFAAITYEILGATIGAPPIVTINGQAQGDSEFHLPNLSDPGYRGESEEGRSQMTFRYTGWITAQKIVRGDALTAGLNNLQLQLSNGSKAVAIRTVSIQLKYNWEKLDYLLSPAPVANETH